MLAIHNQVDTLLCCNRAANAFAKLSKCQQFTTAECPLQSAFQLQTLLQSYQNVSNSQLAVQQGLPRLCCKRFCKVIKMLAIHNQSYQLHLTLYAANAFAKLSKCQQFTTVHLVFKFAIRLQTLLQSYQNVSNSQHLH